MKLSSSNNTDILRIGISLAVDLFGPLTVRQACAHVIDITNSTNSVRYRLNLMAKSGYFRKIRITEKTRTNQNFMSKYIYKITHNGKGWRIRYNPYLQN